MWWCLQVSSVCFEFQLQEVLAEASDAIVVPATSKEVSVWCFLARLGMLIMHT